MLRWALAAAVVGACGRIDFDPHTVTVSVEAANAATDWNTYIHPDGTPCAGSETPWSACSHLGEIRVVTLDGVTGCAGLSIHDALGAFDWLCEKQNGAVFATSKLDDAYGLRDLVTASGWIPNSVIVEGAASGQSATALWWTNPVVEVPDNPAAIVALDQPSTIYVSSVDRMTAGYALTARASALVTLPGTTLTWAGGPSGTPVVQSNADFEWIEANIDATASGYYGVELAGGHFDEVYHSAVANGGNGASSLLVESTSSRVTGFVSVNSAGGGVLVGGAIRALYNYLEDVEISSPAGIGVQFDSGQFNLVDGVIVANGGSDGIDFGSYCDGNFATDNSVSGAQVFGCVQEGVYINSNNNYLSDSVVVGNSMNGVHMTNNCGNSPGSTVTRTVFAFNGASGVNVIDHTVTFVDVVAVGNAMYGLDNASMDTFVNFVATDNALADIHETAAATFEGSLLVTGAGSCSALAGGGVVDGTCDPSAASTAQRFYEGSVLGDFVGPVASATAPAPSTALDWIDLPNAYATWGQWGTAGRWTTGAGMQLDFRLAKSSKKLLGNTAFVADKACPPQLSGDTVAQNDWSHLSLPPQTFLIGAGEITSPAHGGYAPSGNHDGLCESGEACIYTPNFGAYQGGGGLHECHFAGGAVTGATLWGHAANGI
jgi:hypothetical protein